MLISHPERSQNCKVTSTRTPLPRIVQHNTEYRNSEQALPSAGQDRAKPVCRQDTADEGVWYPDACKSVGLEHRIHTPYEKSLMERVNQYLKDRTEVFDDHYPCRKKGCGLSHVRRWLNLFCFMYNKMRDRVKFDGLLNLMEVSP